MASCWGQTTGGGRREVASLASGVHLAANLVVLAWGVVGGAAGCIQV